MKEEPSFLDFEASSLTATSYPIEVAWSLPDSSIESHLISPEGIGKWTDWSFEAQNTHRISRQELMVNGQTPAWVCQRMNQQLLGKVVYTDSPYYDGLWLTELFSVGSGNEPDFELADVDDLLVSTVCPSIVGRVRGLAKIEDIKEKARNRVGKQHRAEWDVMYLVELWKLAEQSRPG
jgi:hypothetical protein